MATYFGTETCFETLPVALKLDAFAKCMPQLQDRVTIRRWTKRSTTCLVALTGHAVSLRACTESLKLSW